jgi:hypothetical protein
LISILRPGPAWLGASLLERTEMTNRINRINPSGEDRIRKAFALLDRVLEMGNANMDQETLAAIIALLREANSLLKEEYESGFGDSELSQAIADLQPILEKFGIATDWKHRN